MKPMLIYSMPRARSHVALESAKRAVKMIEPLGFRMLFKHHITERYDLPAYFDKLVPDSLWEETKRQMDNDNTASKLFGYHLFEIKRARTWWLDLQKAGSHEIFVLERDRTSLCMSMLVGLLIGFTQHNERPAIPLSINSQDLWIVYRYVEEHLRYYPRTGRLITWDDLPAEHFDKQQVTVVNQHSLSRTDVIANREWCQERVAEILEHFKQEWDDKQGALAESCS